MTTAEEVKEITEAIRATISNSTASMDIDEGDDRHIWWFDVYVGHHHIPIDWHPVRKNFGISLIDTRPGMNDVTPFDYSDFYVDTLEEMLVILRDNLKKTHNDR